MHVNLSSGHLRFLRKKIALIKFARFRVEITSALQLPNNVIQALRIEDDGTIWFFTSCKLQQAGMMDKSFYAYLDFYKKGTDLRLQLSGSATIEDGEEDLMTANHQAGEPVGSLVLIKMKIMQAAYFESRMEPVGSWKDKFKIVFNQLFLSNSNRTYDFS